MHSHSWWKCLISVSDWHSPNSRPDHLLWYWNQQQEVLIESVSSTLVSEVHSQEKCQLEFCWVCVHFLEWWLSSQICCYICPREVLGEEPLGHPGQSGLSRGGAAMWTQMLSISRPCRKPENTLSPTSTSPLVYLFLSLWINFLSCCHILL